jgi:hypothetical protein
MGKRGQVNRSTLTTSFVRIMEAFAIRYEKQKGAAKVQPFRELRPQPYSMDQRFQPLHEDNYNRSNKKLK